MAAQQFQTAPDDDAQRREQNATLDSDGLPSGERLSLAEMSRIMDVATTLRKERALVEEQLNIDQIKAKLRERLIAAARVSGDTVSEAEVDAAVEQYYDRLHEFAEPPASWRTMVAHVWVRRGPIVKIVVAVAAAAAVIWGMFFAGLLPGSRRDAMQAEAKLEHVEEVVEQIRGVTDDAGAIAEAAGMLSAAQSAREQGELASLNDVAAAADSLYATLMQDYTVRIDAAPDGESGFVQEFTDDAGTRVSGFYVIVDAVDARGNAVAVPIRNRETGQTQRVSRWAEQVPEEVFNRLAADKQADGVLDEIILGEKKRGERILTMQLPGADGEPIERMGQITSWD
ncbi:MAG: hypothetical protein CMJ58_23915 [Planctomycetaceae bacterium]|nr:hypothetical protein [Planctomycetaceae bacterium]